MTAYYKKTVKEFLADGDEYINGALNSKYANDGYFQLLSSQGRSWEESFPIIKENLQQVTKHRPEALNWGVLLEYPLYRLRRRIDVVLISTSRVYVIEMKVGARDVESGDLRQVEEYCLDLRDFHRASHDIPISPVLCCTELAVERADTLVRTGGQIQDVRVASGSSLSAAILFDAAKDQGDKIDWSRRETSPYEPVPTIIEAATTIFAGHNVKEISRSDAANLDVCSNEVVRLIHEAKTKHKKRIIVVTGVPGAGKTLAGLNVVHRFKEGESADGQTIYLSGNTPLVLVIREALAQDEKARAERSGEKRTLKDIRHELRSRIQHINDFLKEYYLHDLEQPPFEHAIVFDEAQRAWDHKQGKDKFDRDASEPELLMQIMDRHEDWAAIVCLVGAGQEINSGEPGMQQWGEAIEKDVGWELVTPANAIDGSVGTAGTALFPDGVPSQVELIENDALALKIPLRSYRSENVSRWVDAVLEDRPQDAYRISQEMGDYPITLVRSIDACRALLKSSTRGQRRCGLMASAGASRLVAEGLGVSLNVQDKQKIAHWYLKPHGDYRSSNSLEVTANEYTSQGLEVDFAGVCWGGDMVRESNKAGWCFRRLHKTTWQNVHNADTRRYVLNKYRVFLTRAREGMVLFVPYGDSGDSTRVPGTYEAIADYLLQCGVQSHTK